MTSPGHCEWKFGWDEDDSATLHSVVRTASVLYVRGLLSTKASSVRHVDIDHSYWRARCYRVLSEALPDNNVLESLRICENGVDANDVWWIAAVLAKNSHLTSLSLGSKCLNGRACEWLARGFRSNECLLELHLSKNQIGATGA